jgi:two-component system, NarL family, response regulator NreC
MPGPISTGVPHNSSDGHRIRVVLAEAHSVMRRSLRQLLDAEEHMEVVAEATDAATTSRLVRTHQPQVLVMDLRLPDGVGMQTIRRLRSRAPGTEIVALTMHDASVVARNALDAGAIGIVLKDTADTELVAAVRCAAHGQPYTSPRLAVGRASRVSS